MAARYRPVARNSDIGGDWYDAFRLPDQRLAVVVGDVMGKGLTATGQALRWGQRPPDGHC